jgi:tetratricopeptide (TPR) repeat protein
MEPADADPNPPAPRGRRARRERARRESAGSANPAPPAAAPERSLLVSALAVVAVTLLAFLPVLRNGFIDWDDPTAIADNPLLHPPTTEKLERYWTSPSLGHEFYVPLNYTAYWVLAKVAGAGTDGRVPAWPFHTGAWLAHALGAVLVLVILRRLTGNRWAAAAGAAVFAVHPVQVEPVAWASSLYSPLSGVLALVAVWQYLVFSDARHAAAGEPRGRAWVHYALATAAFAAGMLTKPTVVVVPPIIGVIELVLRRRRLRDVAVPLGVWLLAALPVMHLARAAEQSSVTYAPEAPWRVLVALDALAFYLLKLFVPLRLVPDYGRSPQWLLSQPQAYYTWVAPVVVLAVAWHFRRRNPWILGAVLVMGAALLPVLGLVPFDYQRYSTVADRYLYLAMLGPAIAVAWLLSRHGNGGVLAAAGAVVVVLAVLTFVQAPRWRDSRTLFGYTLSVNPRSLAAHLVLGSQYAAKGNDAAALAEFDQALAANPGDAAALGGAGHIYLRQGKFEQAAEAYRQALAYGGGHPALNINLGAALAQAGRLDEAQEALQTAVARLPDNAEAHANLGNVLAVRRDYAGARQHYETALKLDPNSGVARRGLAALNAAGR